MSAHEDPHHPQHADDLWDAVVIGGGPAGLSAALMLGRARRRTLVIDAGSPRNRFASHMHGVLGHEGTDPADLVRRGRAETATYGVQHREGSVLLVEDGGTTMTITTDIPDLPTVRARAVVLASGLTDELPAVPGLSERWGSTVLHCPYCHGWEVRDQRLAALPTSPAGLHIAQLLRQWSAHVTLFTALVGPVDHALAERLRSRGVTIVDEPVTAVLGEGSAVSAVLTADGVEHQADAVFTAGAPAMHDGAVRGLALEHAETPMGRTLTLDPTQRTSHTRVWAVGNAAKPFANVPISMGDGSMAGSAVNAFLVAEEFDDADPAAFWERRYAAADSVWSGAVNATLAEVVAEYPPGRSLDLGCGEGADALWLAERGWSVHGVDISATAIARARAAARERDLDQTRVTFETADLSRWQPVGSYDLITASFLQSPVALARHRIIRSAIESLAPGGRLVVITHASTTSGHGDGEHQAERHSSHEDVSAETDAAQLNLDPARWLVLTSTTRSRALTPREDSVGAIADSVLVVERRDLGT